MSWAAMVMAIVLIVTIGRILTSRHAASHPDGDAALASADAARAAEEIRQLKERVAVLERLVTDTHSSIGLDREIERLRDRREG